MRKLKLESLEVESFETTSFMPGARGTVEGHRPNTDGCGTTVVQPGTNQVSVCIICQPHTVDWQCGPLTYDLRCGETQYMDCTFGCTINCSGIRGCSYGSGCPDVCWIEIGQSQVCPVE